MTVKDGAKDWTIKEQIIKDPASELTFQFERIDSDPDGRFRMRIYGDALPFGNREIIFDSEGVESGGGTMMGGLCKPTWLTKID